MRASAYSVKEPLKVVICVATCDRPQFLDRTLSSLKEIPARSQNYMTAAIVVVDNSQSGSAQQTVYSHSQKHGVPIVYEREPRRGIPFARNRAVTTARSFSPDAIAFIDDDEVAEPDWLDSLTSTLSVFNAAMVEGVVQPQLDDGGSHWLLESGFFDRSYPETGAPLNTVGAGNLLCRLDVLLDPPFDTRLRNLGAEDTDLALRLRDAGHRIVMCRAAVVRETIPRSRCSVWWLVRRSFRGGVTYSLCAIRNGRCSRLRRIVAAALRIVQGVSMLTVAIFRGRVALVRALRTLSLGIGGILGCCGVSYEEYKTIHGH